MVERFQRCTIMVVADFRVEGADALPLAVRALGGEVKAFGIGTGEVKRRLKASGVDIRGIGRSRKPLLQAALDEAGLCDGAVFGSGEWETEFYTVRAAEYEQAGMDGRSPQPVLTQADENYGFLSSPGEWAAFVLARAAGVRFDEAKAFAIQNSRGHKKQDHQPERRRESRRGSARKGSPA